MAVWFVPFSRQLAKNQMVRFKKEPAFHWLNMAPGGRRLSVEDVAMVVAKWFRQDREQEEHSGVEGGEEEGAWLPSEWDGKVLQTLVCDVYLVILCKNYVWLRIGY